MQDLCSLHSRVSNIKSSPSSFITNYANRCWAALPFAAWHFHSAYRDQTKWNVYGHFLQIYLSSQTHVGQAFSSVRKHSSKRCFSHDFLSIQRLAYKLKWKIYAHSILVVQQKGTVVVSLQLCLKMCPIPAFLKLHSILYLDTSKGKVCFYRCGVSIYCKSVSWLPTFLSFSQRSLFLIN